jgi:hypothetical protein
MIIMHHVKDQKTYYYVYLNGFWNDICIRKIDDFFTRTELFLFKAKLPPNSDNILSLYTYLYSNSQKTVFKFIGFVKIYGLKLNWSKKRLDDFFTRNKFKCSGFPYLTKTSKKTSRKKLLMFSKITEQFWSTTKVTCRAKMDRLPSTLFDALSTKDLDGMIYLYALSGRSALTRIARFAGVSTSVTDPQFSSGRFLASLYFHSCI